MRRNIDELNKSDWEVINIIWAKDKATVRKINKEIRKEQNQSYIATKHLDSIRG